MVGTGGVSECGADEIGTAGGLIRKPSGSRLGKTGAELFDSGWTTGMGYDLESMEFYLEYAPFMYTVTFEKQEQLENTDDFDEEAAVASLKVVSVSFSGLGNSATEIPEYSEEFADE